MSVLLFAILDASAARSALDTPRRALAKAQDRYDRALATAEARANSKNAEVRQRANAALTAALDALDACRDTFEAAQERSAQLDQAEKDAYARPVELLPADTAEYRQLNQHRACHA
jgi:hypothetical protein